MLEVVKDMESLHTMYLLLGISSAWYTHSAFSKYLDKEVKKIDAENEKESKKIDAEKDKELIKALKEVALNKPFQDSMNNRTRDILSILEDDEKFNTDTATLTHSNLDEYKYKKPEIDDIEEEPAINEYRIESYNFVKEGKLFKLSGVRTLANSEVMSADKRIKLMQEADNKNLVRLKVKITKDGLTEKIKSIHILDLIEE